MQSGGLKRGSSADLEDVWINAEVTRVTPATPLTPLQVELASGHVQEFDAAVLATHTDTSLKLLGQSASEVPTHLSPNFLPAILSIILDISIMPAS